MTMVTKYQERLYDSLPSIHLDTDNSSILLLRSELGHLREQLLKKTNQLQQQQLDMEQLNTKYVAALDQVATIQHEKDLAERELEDLTCRLFEQANVMVANEKRQVHKLRTELELAKQQLAIEKEKHRETALEQHHTVRTSTEPLDHPLSQLQSLPPGLTCMDSLYEQVFHQFHQQLVLKPCLSQNKHNPFMRQCLVGDVEPCLNFGSNSRLPSIKKMVDSMLQQPCVLEEMHSPDVLLPAYCTSIVTPSSTSQSSQSSSSLQLSSFPSFSSSSSSPSSSSSSPSSLQSSPLLQSTAAATATHAVAAAASGIGLRWSRFLSGVSLVDCAGCGNTLDMQHYYRFRLNEEESDWLHIDTPCHDRLMAVCSFFGFLRQIALASVTDDNEKDTHAELSPFMEITLLRLTMFYARLGIKRSSCLLDDNDSVISAQGPMTPVSSVSTTHQDGK